MSMIGTKGYFLKIIAMSGAIDLEGIRIFYQTHNGRRVKDKNMKILRENGYIQKAVFRRKSYYHLTQKGKDIVLAGEVKNTLDCSEYLTGNVVTNIMPLSYKDNKDKVQRCIYQGRILAEMYQGRIPIFWTDKEDIFKNEKKVRYVLEQRMEEAGSKRDTLMNMAEEIWPLSIRKRGKESGNILSCHGDKESQEPCIKAEPGIRMSSSKEKCTVCNILYG